MLYDFLHLFSGFVRFKAYGGFAERFINFCTADGISLWGICKTPDGLRAQTTAAGYKKIRSAAKASGVRVRLERKIGLPFFLRKYESYSGLLVGFTAVVLALSLMSGSIWVINVYGNETVEVEEIEEAFAEAGLKIGTRKRRLKKDGLDEKIIRNIGEISWSSVSIDGSVAEIKVIEAEKKPKIEKSTGTANIVARKDGQIEIIEPYKGSAAIKAGQTVMQGQLLVSGVTQTKNGTSLFSDAQGYAVARTTLRVKTENKARQSFSAQTKKIYSLYIFGKEISLSKKREADIVYHHKSWLYIGGVRMPFGIFYTQYTDIGREKKTTPQASELAAMNEYALKSYNETLHAQIISQHVTNENGSITGEYICFENIAERREFEVINEQESLQPFVE